MAKDYASELLGGGALMVEADPPMDRQQSALPPPLPPVRGGAPLGVSGSGAEPSPSGRMTPRPKSDVSMAGGKDYASELLGGTPQPTGNNGTPQQGASFSDLPISNRETFDGTAAFSTLTKASMVDDPQTKLRIFAKARFPKLPEAEALKRYGMIDGEVVYLADDGKLYRDTPPGFLGWMKEAGAGMTGSPFTTAGGIVGGVIGAPFGGFGAAGGAALGAAGGRGFDKTVANVAFDEPQSVGGNVKAMGVDAAFSAGGSLVGSALGKFLERNLARDITRLNTGATTDLVRKATREGIDLNPAQATNLPSLKAKYDVLASMPTSRDTIAEGATRQSTQAMNAAENLFKRISPAEGLDETGTAARDAAKRIIAGMVEDRSKKAKPLYDLAFERFEQSGGIPQSLMGNAESLMKTPAMIAAGKKAVELAKNEGIDLADPRKSLHGMHYMKLALDDMIGTPKEGVGAVERRQFTNLKSQLVQIMDELSPDYAEARKVFAHYSPAVNNVREGIVSKLADMGDEATHKAAAMVFSGNLSPKTVARTKMLFYSAGLNDQWDGVLRAYLQSTWEQAGKQGMTAGGAATQAPRWQANLWGNPQQKKLIEAAMEPAQRAAMSDLMDVFNAMARTSYAGQGSQTMPRQEAARLLRQDAGTSVVSKGARLLSPQNWGDRLGSFLDEVRLGNHAQKLAEIMTSPDGMRRLKELKKLAPGDKQFIQGAASLFGLSVAPESGGSGTAR